MKTLSTWKATWQADRCSAPSTTGSLSLLYILFFSSRLVPGLLTQAFFDTLTGEAPANLGLWSVLALLAAAGLARIVADFSRDYSEETFRCYGWALLRKNIIANVLRRPGAYLCPCRRATRSAACGMT